MRPGLVTMEVGGLVEVVSWVLGFGRQAEVLQPAHLREAVGRELAATMGKYVGKPAQPPQEEAEKRTW